MSADIPAVRLARTARTMLVSYKAASLVFALLRFLAKALHETSSALRHRALIYASIAAGRRALPDALQSHSSLPEAAAGCLVQRTRRVCKLLRQRDAPTAEAAKHK